jgi:hypothetical protein
MDVPESNRYGIKSHQHHHLQGLNLLVDTILKRKASLNIMSNFSMSWKTVNTEKAIENIMAEIILSKQGV